MHLSRVQYPRFAIAAAAAAAAKWVWDSNICVLHLATNKKRGTPKWEKKLKTTPIPYIKSTHSGWYVCAQLRISNWATTTLIHCQLWAPHHRRARQEHRTTYHHFNSFQFHLIFVHNWNRLGSISILAVVHLIANRPLFGLHCSIRSSYY